MKKILLISTFVFYAIFAIGQPTKAFFTVHCDPNEAYNFPNLEPIVDSANAYGIKLSIEITAPWVEHILPFPSALNKIIIWQSQGHEIGLHHHSVEAPNMWDGFSNLSMAEIDAAGRDTLDFIGDIDSLYNYVQQISNFPLRTIGQEDSIDMPSLDMYQTAGQSVEHGYSNPFSYSYNGQDFCKITYCFIATPVAEQQLENEFPSMTDYDVMGAVCHVYNFVDNCVPIIDYFKFINEQSIASMTVAEILDLGCTGLSVEKVQNVDELLVFPNPFFDVLNIYSDDFVSQFSSFSVYNSLGQLITQVSIDSDLEPINTEAWFSGIYFIQLITSDGTIISKKIIKK